MGQYGQQISDQLGFFISVSIYQRAHSCSSLVRTIFSFSSSLLYSFVGYNWNCGTSHLTHYSEAETDIADWIRLVRQNFGINSAGLYMYNYIIFCTVYRFSAVSGKNIKMMLSATFHIIQQM